MPASLAGNILHVLTYLQIDRDSLAEWSKALAQGASPQGRGFEPHSCQLLLAFARASTRSLIARAKLSGTLCMSNDCAAQQSLAAPAPHLLRKKQLMLLCRDARGGCAGMTLLCRDARGSALG